MKKTTSSKSRTVSRKAFGTTKVAARAAAQSKEPAAPAGPLKKKAVVASVASRAVAKPVAAAKIPVAPGKATPSAGKKSPAPAPTPASAVSVKLPAILFEGDFPPTAPVAAVAVVPTGLPGRFELGPTTTPPTTPLTPPPPVPARAVELPELPESYGTGRLLLTPRDPFWLYAHWDFSFEHLRRFNSRAVDGHLVLRVYQNEVGGSPVAEVQLHPESREWFVPVPVADTAYVADLGYYSAPGCWKSVVQSAVVRTPAATMSAEVTVQFATVPVEAAVQQVLEAVQESSATTPTSARVPTPAAVPSAPLPPVPMEAARAGAPTAVSELTPVESAASVVPVGAQRERMAPASSAAPATGTPTAWTAAQERAFAAIIQFVDDARRTRGGSEELAALIRRQLDVTPVPTLVPPGQSAAQPPSAAPSSACLTTPATPAKAGFWFNVNAELVIYGATEPGAEVTIGGRVVKLRADGTFGYRFALPDGDFALPVVAVAADRTEGRAADLRFSRETEYRGEVAAHPQDPALKPPTVENVG
ncbi:hypothetical protein LBMAG56_18530 [Verrucomicrobiota bacterium]|nr:hypothetical protein LBMAG56_18530 [Verrucomicrobiota bacterium]